MPQWNEMQLKAIETKQKNVLVSASAGSGKTTVLIERLMRLVMEERVEVDAILAMTFTEAAANEMKKRLAAALQSAYDTSTKEEEKAYITRQLTSIQTAHISTIHSFCLSIIQDYYYIIGLDPARISSIMDNGVMEQAKSEALSKAFDIQYEKQDEDFLHTCMMFSSRAENNDALAACIQNLANLSSSKPNPKQWLEDMKEMYHDIHTLDDIPSFMQDIFFDYLHVQMERYHEVLDRLAYLYEYRYSEEEKKRTAVMKKYGALGEVEKTLEEKDYEAFRLAFRGIAQGIIPTSPDKEDNEYHRLRKQSQELEDELLAILFSSTTFLQDIQTLYPIVSKLVEMTLDYRNAYQTIKEEIQCIDFDDMEHFALEILQAKDGEVADIYRNQFVEIMVDEFQDSNDVQNELVLLICKENNVFRVGDIKQSIYGFRHAKPQLMKGLITNKKENDEVIYLSNNYRSKKMIVDFNNILFKELMNTDGFSCSYAKEDDVETGVPAQNEDNLPICFHAIFHDEIKKENDLILSKNDFKASYISHEILRKHEEENRKWKDFVVLVRSNARKENLKAAFDKLNIPYFIDVKSGFYQSNAVQIMLSTLRALLHPQEDIPFMAAMTSPLFQYNVEDFAHAKLQKEKTQSYYAWFKEHASANFNVFEDLRTNTRTLSLPDMLNLLYNTNDYYALHTTLQEKTNLDLLYEKAVNFEDSYATGIAGFLSQIEQIKDAQTAEAIPIGSEADVVRVMSIHQSKGLQFPVVYLWSSDSFSMVENKEFCMCDADMGIALKCMDLPQRYVRTTWYRLAMEHKKNKEELEEEMRILYVATTRAQQEMHIVDCVLSLDTYNRPLTMSAIYERNGYSSWILQSFLQNPNPLFTIQEVHQLWNDIPLPEEIHPVSKTFQYQKDTKKLEIITPTSIQKEHLPELNLHKQVRGSSYGTKMHKLMETIGEDAFSIENIKEKAEMLGLQLYDKQMHSITTLYEHPIYQEALQGQCFHELPFMVKKEDMILHGYMDFVSIQDKIMIIDFKTDALEKEEDFKKLYASQLSQYKEAMHILYPSKDIHTYIYSFHLENMIKV